jgi:hypothetical protein
MTSFSLGILSGAIQPFAHRSEYHRNEVSPAAYVAGN